MHKLEQKPLTKMVANLIKKILEAKKKHTR